MSTSPPTSACDGEAPDDGQCTPRDHDDNAEHDRGCPWLPPELWTEIFSKLKLKDLLVTQHVSKLFQAISRASMDRIVSDEGTCKVCDAFEHNMDYMTDEQVVDLSQYILSCKSCKFRLYPGLAYRLARVDAIAQLRFIVDGDLLRKGDIPELRSAVSQLLREGRLNDSLGYLFDTYLHTGKFYDLGCGGLVALLLPAARKSTEAESWLDLRFRHDFLRLEVLVLGVWQHF